MPSNAIPSTPSVTVAVPLPSALPASNGRSLPPGGNSGQAAPAAATSPSSLQSLVTVLNKFLNDTGRPDQYRLDPTAPDQTIQEINPANGEVIAEFSSSDFPALARSLGMSGALLDSRA
jgi:hypothetical protein